MGGIQANDRHRKTTEYQRSFGLFRDIENHSL